MTSTPIEPWNRVIVHADMDAFFAAVEELDNPKLKNLPLAIGGKTSRGVVATANYIARRYGIHSAMPMATAKRLCSNLVIVPPRIERYRAISKIVLGVFRSFTPKLEPLSLDEAFLDMTDHGKRFDSPEKLGISIKRAVFEATSGLTVSVGISTTKAVAKIASDINKPDGLTVVYPNTVTQFLAPLPVSKLWGVGPKSLKRLTDAGFMTIGDVAKASDQELGFLGSQGPAYRRLAQGIDYRHVGARGRPKSIGWERTLETDLPISDALMTYVKSAVIGVCSRMKDRKLKTRGIRIKLKTSDFRIITRQQHLAEATDDAETLMASAQDLLGLIDKREHYRLVGVTTFSLIHDKEGLQMSLFEQKN